MSARVCVRRWLQERDFLNLSSARARTRVILMGTVIAVISFLRKFKRKKASLFYDRRDIWHVCSLLVFVYENKYEKEIFSILCSARARVRESASFFGENMIAVVFSYGEWRQLIYRMLIFVIILQSGESLSAINKKK